MSGGLVLIMAQIDDAPGELLGRVMGQMSEMGAKNIQLLSSLGKKGRPSYVLLVDVLSESEEDFAALLAGELGIWGYRVLQSEHRHFDIRRHTVELDLRYGGKSRRFPLRFKRIFKNGKFMRIKVEHDDLSSICRDLGADGHSEYLAVLKARVEAALACDDSGEALAISLDV